MGYAVIFRFKTPGFILWVERVLGGIFNDYLNFKNYLFAKSLGLFLVLFYLVRLSIASLWLGPFVSLLTLGGYAILIICFFYLLFTCNKKFFVASCCYIVITFLGVITSEFLLKAFMKWSGWFFLFSIAGPFFRTKQAIVFRQSSWLAIQVTFIVISLISFAWFVSGAPNLGRGIFTGIMLHSMLISPISGIACLLCTSLYIKTRLHIYILFSLISLVICTIAASRTAVAGVAIGILIQFIIFKSLKTFNIMKVTIKLLPIAIIVAMLYIPNFHILNNFNIFTVNIQNKGSLDTRSNLWLARIDEFYDKPILGYGIGMGSGYGFDIDESGNTAIEPGSSYLSILSMTGILGFICFISVVLPILVQGILKIKKNDNFSYYIHEMLVILSFLFVHMVAEGWIYAVGSPFCLLFWLSLGRLSDLVHLKNTKSLSPSPKLSFRHL